jgi:parvulin-like peptidyl-prolyl isomerase
LLKHVLTLTAGAALLASAVALSGCDNSGGGKTGGDDVAATVNGTAIPVSKVDQLIDQQIKQAGPGAQQQLTPVALAAARLQILDQLVQEEALFQRAQKENVIPTDDEVKQALQTQIQQSRMSQDDYQQRLKQMGQTEEQLKDDLKRTLAIQKLQDKVTATIPAPTDAEMRKFFDENKAQLVAPRGLDLSDIIVDPQSNGATDDAVGVEAAAKKAQEIAAALRANTDFATVARARSEDQSGLQGGAIGFFSDDRLRQTFPPDVLSTLASKQVGQFTDPIQGQDGRWHIFKVNGRRDQAQEMTYDQVKDQIAQSITDQRKQVVLSALLRDAVSSATIKNNLAAQIVQHPDNFGALRPSPLTQAPAGQAAPQQTAPQQQPSATQPATNAPAEAQPGGPAKPAAPETKKTAGENKK